MSEQVFEGKTVEDALARAAAEMDVRIDDLDHEVVEEGAEDFWGLDEPTTRIRVWMKGEEEEEQEDVEPEPEGPQAAETAPPPPREAEAEPEQPRPEASREASEEPAAGFWEGGDEPEPEGPAPAIRPTKAVAEAEAEEEAEEEEAEEAAPPPPQEREPAFEEAGEEAEERAVASVSPEDAPKDEFEGLPEEIEDPVPEIRELLARVFEDMSFECEAEIAEDAEQIDVMISGPDKDYLVENSGKGISALELILNHAFRHRLPRGRKIRVDAGDFRSRREEELRDLAFQVAHSAKQSGKTQETQELNPYERRLVHLALADDESVTTRSRGQGFLKHVQVIPQDRG